MGYSRGFFWFSLRESVLTHAGKFSSRVRVLLWVLLPHQASRKPRFSYLAAGSQRVFCLGRLWFSPALGAAVLGLLLKNLEKVADLSIFFSVLRSPALCPHTCVIRTGWWFPSFLHARLETKVFDCYPVFKNMWHFGKIFSSFNLSCHNYEADWESFAWNFMFVCLFVLILHKFSSHLFCQFFCCKVWWFSVNWHLAFIKTRNAFNEDS